MVYTRKFARPAQRKFTSLMALRAHRRFVILWILRSRPRYREPGSFHSRHPTLSRQRKPQTDPPRHSDPQVLDKRDPVFLWSSMPAQGNGSQNSKTGCLAGLSPQFDLLLLWRCYPQSRRTPLIVTRRVPSSETSGRGNVGSPSSTYLLPLRTRCWPGWRYRRRSSGWISPVEPLRLTNPLVSCLSMASDFLHSAGIGSSWFHGYPLLIASVRAPPGSYKRLACYIHTELVTACLPDSVSWPPWLRLTLTSSTFFASQPPLHHFHLPAAKAKHRQLPNIRSSIAHKQTGHLHPWRHHNSRRLHACWWVWLFARTWADSSSSSTDHTLPWKPLCPLWGWTSHQQHCWAQRHRWGSRVPQLWKLCATQRSGLHLTPTTPWALLNPRSTSDWGSTCQETHAWHIPTPSNEAQACFTVTVRSCWLCSCTWRLEFRLWHEPTGLECTWAQSFQTLSNSFTLSNMWWYCWTAYRWFASMFAVPDFLDD